jgi:chloramphenicol-sensitive protein RarD
VLGERLRRLQWVAVAIAALAVAVITAGYGTVPLVAIALALSWGGYSLVKKLVRVDALASLTVETAYGAPVALAYLLWLQSTGALTFGHHGAGTTTLLILTGVVTAVPLVLFGGAANRIPLSTIGILQYLTPTIQFVLGIAVFHEQMPPARWAGFALIWLGLCLFGFDSVRHSRRPGRTAATDAADEVEAPV